MARSKDFGSVQVGTNASLTFIITNLGTADLTGLGITVDGADATCFMRHYQSRRAGEPRQQYDIHRTIHAGRHGPEDRRPAHRQQ